MRPGITVPQRLCKCGHSSGMHTPAGCKLCRCMTFAEAVDAEPDTIGPFIVGKPISEEEFLEQLACPTITCQACGWSGPPDYVHECTPEPRTLTLEQAERLIQSACKAYDADVMRARQVRDNAIRLALEGTQP